MSTPVPAAPEPASPVPEPPPPVPEPVEGPAARRDPRPAVEPDVTLDATGLLCPQPVLLLARAARALGSGLIAVTADDPAAESDIPAWCRMRSARLVATTAIEGTTRYLVRVGGSSSTADRAST